MRNEPRVVIHFSEPGMTGWSNDYTDKIGNLNRSLIRLATLRNEYEELHPEPELDPDHGDLSKRLDAELKQCASALANIQMLIGDAVHARNCSR